MGYFKWGGGVEEEDRTAFLEADCPESKATPCNGAHGGKESRWTQGSFQQTDGAVLS